MTREPTAPLRIATYNVHGCVGLDGRRDVDRVGRVIGEARADVVGLQEVVRGGDPDPLDRLAAQTGMTAVYGRTRAHGEGSFGNALLTRLPVERVEHHDLTHRAREARALLDVRMRAGARVVRVLVTHFGLRFRERAAQVARVLALLDRPTDEIVVLLGDFNEWRPRAVALAELHAFFGWAPPVRSFPARFPMLALDRVWVRPRDHLASVTAVKTPSSRIASDHLPVLAEVDVGGDARLQRPGDESTPTCDSG